MAPVLWSKIHLSSDTQRVQPLDSTPRTMTSLGMSPAFWKPEPTTTTQQNTPGSSTPAPPNRLKAQDLCDHFHALPLRPDLLKDQHKPCPLGLSTYGDDDTKVPCNKHCHKVLLECVFCEQKMCRKCWRSMFPQNGARTGTGPNDFKRIWGKEGSKRWERQAARQGMRM